MTKIVVVGATGHLGGRIVRALLEGGAEVHALVRPETALDKVQTLRESGAEVVEVEMADTRALAGEFKEASCVVSALQGLHDVIIGTQSVLAEAASMAGVPRFISSDYSMDFTKLPRGQNRNLDLRYEFFERLGTFPIATTSILNGAFMDLLLGQMPLLNFEEKRVTYWGSPDTRLDFTTMDDTAAFTAAAALDQSTPRIVRVAGDKLSPRDIARVAGEVVGGEFELVHAGSLKDLAGMIDKERANDPEGENNLYPRWQTMQYVHGMFSGKGELEPLDNERYPDIQATTVRDLLASR